MALTFKQTTGAVVTTNKESAILAAKLTAGNILNERVVKLVKPQLPVLARGYADTEIGKAVAANVTAAALIHFFPTNQKAVAAAECMIQAAMAGFVASFDIEGTVNELLDGINIPELAAVVEGE
jgi:hypothetical protein